MSILLLLITVIISVLAVRIGAIAFELTGLERSIARFQALSCFSGTGFTTRESESITSHAQRRRIASTLMILGNAGFVTMIATFAGSLSPSFLSLSFIDTWAVKIMPRFLVSWFNVALLAGALYLIYWVMTREIIALRIRKIVRKKLIDFHLVKPTYMVESTVGGDGYGIAHIHVAKGSHLVGKLLGNITDQHHVAATLAVDRPERTIVGPCHDIAMREGDTIICFGKLKEMKELFGIK